MNFRKFSRLARAKREGESLVQSVSYFPVPPLFYCSAACCATALSHIGHINIYIFTHYGSSIPAFRFTRSGGHIRRNLCVREGVCIHTRCVYTPTALTYHSRKRTYLRIRTLGCVYAPACVYTPTAACLRPCANAASGVYTHLPRTCVYAPASTRDGRRVFGTMIRNSQGIDERYDSSKSIHPCGTRYGELCRLAHGHLYM